MSAKSSNQRKRTVQSIKLGRRVVVRGAFGVQATGKKLNRSRFVAINKKALAETKPAPVPPRMFTGKMRLKHKPESAPYALCECGSGKKVKFCKHTDAAPTTNTQ